MCFNLCRKMKKENSIEHEILHRGYYGIGIWLSQYHFETTLSRDMNVMAEVNDLVDKCYGRLSDKLFHGVEVNDVDYEEMPQVCEFVEKVCPSEFKASEWTKFAQEVIYDKLSLAERITYPMEFPSWCDMLAEYVLMMVGRKCAADDRFQNLELITRLKEQEDLAWEFYKGFHLSEDVLKQAEQSLEIKPQEILGGSRMLEMSPSAYELSGKTKEQIMADLWRYEQNGGYIEFPEIIVAVARGYIDAGMDDALVALWSKLVHPTLQYGFLFYIVSQPKDCFTLLELMKKNGLDEVSMTLIRDYWFNASVKSMENLLPFEQHRDMKDVVVAEIIPIADKVRTCFEGWLKEASQNLLDYFSAENLTQWAYAKNTLGDKPDSIYKKSYLTVLNSLKEVLDTIAAVGTFSTDTKDLSYLIYLAQKAIDVENKGRCEQIEGVVLKLLDGGNFGWFGNMNQEVVNQMCVLASLLHGNHTNDEITKMVTERLVKYEGWNVTPIKDVSEQTYTGSYILSAALLVESEETYFRKLVNQAIDQANNVTMPSDALLAPLYVAEMVATQPRKEYRDWFEETVLMELESFESVLKVLLQAQTAMSDENKKLFVKRKNTEWGLVKLQYHTTKRQLEWRNMEKMMKDLESKTL